MKFQYAKTVTNNELEGLIWRVIHLMLAFALIQPLSSG